MTDLRLVPDCGLYPNYKKIIDFTGTKSQIITKQLAWIDSFNPDTFSDVNYNKLQNKLVLEIDYETALTYTYAVLTDLSGSSSGTRPMFMFINDIQNLSGGDDDLTPSVAIYLSLDPIMTFMGEYDIAECTVTREHVDRWSSSSTAPIRLTPNKEGVDGFEQYVSSERLTPYLAGDIYPTVLCVLATVGTDGDIHYYGFPVSTTATQTVLTTRVLYGHTVSSTTYVYPTVAQVINGDIIDKFGFTPSEVVNLFVLPLFSEYMSITARSASTGPIYDVDFSSVYGYKYNNGYCMVELDASVGVPFQNPKTISISVPCATKPTDGDNYSTSAEPARFISPFYRVTLTDGIQDLFDIPGNILFNSEGTVELKVMTQLSCSSPGTLVYIGDSVQEAIGNNSITFFPAIQLELGNDAWQEYCLTERDADRQIVINNSIKEAIDNLVYMGYGGALVGSRSATNQKLINPGFRGYGSYSGVRFYDGGGTGAYAWEHTANNAGKNILPSLTGAGKRMASATGLAAGASIVTSLVDGAVAWENQLQYENKIKNTRSGLLQGGASISRLISGNMFAYIVVRKIDDINDAMLSETYKKYGYYVNKSEVPDTQSRKYYNYLMTNGAIITGAINQGIRDTIASIFDAGVTIFHYDSGDSTTRNLEYTDYENIEVSLT